MSEREVIIETENLSRHYGAFVAVDHVSFSCRRGEIVGFLGPNGAGKTTTMRILAGYMPPTDGAAYIAGYNTLTQSLQARRHLGYLPESVPLYDEMTVEGYLHYIAELRRLEDTRDRVWDALEWVGLLERADSYIGKLSKGMRQRLGLAQAIMHEPDALILDEPTIGLDPRQVADVREVIRRLGERHTILLSTHIMSEVEQLCHRAIMIFDGRVETDMPLADVRASDRELSLTIRLAAPDPAVAPTLRDIAGVSRVEPAGSGVFRLRTDGRDATRLAVVDAIYTGGWGLLELTPEKVTLETVFLRNLRRAESKRGATPIDIALGSGEEEE